jgi:hypothetical protein
MSHHRRRRGAGACRPGLEPLERRRVLAQFGVPWHDADHLTVSFVPDGAPVGAQASDLFRALDAVEPTADWQRQILSAFQAWSMVASVNFGLRPDGGQPLGTPGPDQGDPRFGDIRIAAVPMSPEVLAISVPHDPFLSGTWSGDILLNSAAIGDGGGPDLLPIMLHEIGHVLGIDDSTDPDSVMFPHVDPTHDGLTPGDVAAVQALYGVRDADPFEGDGGDDTLATAAPLPTPSGFDGTTPLLIYASVSTASDADVYSFQAPDGYQGPATVRLQTAGVSLLAPRLTVFDASGAEVADLSATGDVGDTLRYTLPPLVPGESYRVEVRGATADAFGVGEYALAVVFDARSTVSEAQIDTLARQTYSYLSADDIAAIFRDPQGVLFHDDHHANDTMAAAEPLEPDGAYGSDAPVRVTASLGDPSDVDVYRFETPDDPASQPLVMTVTVRATEVNGIMPSASVLDEQGNPVPALVLAHGDGTFTIQVAGARPDAAYFVRVAADPSSGKVVGNYDLDVEFGHEAAEPTTFLSSSPGSPSSPRSYDLVVTQTQLFDFLLSPSGATEAGLRMTLADASGRVVASRTAADGQTAGGDPVLLTPGVYRVSFAVAGPVDGPAPPPAFLLYGASLTDPIGPALDDPTLNPVSGPSSGAVPPVIGSTDAPYFWLAVGLSNPSPTIGPAATEAPRAASGREAAGAAEAAGPAVFGLPGGPASVVLVVTGSPGAAATVRSTAGPATAPTSAVATAARVVAAAPAPSVVPPVSLGEGGPSGPEAEVTEAPVPGAGSAVVRALPRGASPDGPRPLPAPVPPAPPTRPGPRAEGRSRPDRMPGEEARARPDIAPVVAIVGIAAMASVRAHSRRLAPAVGTPPRPSRCTRSSRGPRTIRTLGLCRG